ncbi:MAG: 3-hydroxyacyl-CoA dehydrogenase NAD-binding domain-containing protein [Alphaproteobacteria bacterium]
MTKAAVIGLGTMGPGIAQTLARTGMTVTAYDPFPEAREKAPAAIAFAKNILTNLGVELRGSGEVTITDDLAKCVEGAELVVETVPEKLEIKAEVFQALDAIVGSDCILASNTSGIPVTKLQEGISNPGRVVGMHWSNPPHVIPMIEVIAGAQTSTATVDWMCDTIQGLGLHAVVVKKDIPGFVENRILYALLRECVDLVDQGVIDAEGLDTCVSWGIGYKLSVIGPMALLDVAGLDIYNAVGSYLNKELCNRGDMSPFVTDRIAAGKLGIKTGGGVYDYTPEKIKELVAERGRKLVAVRKALES